LDNIRRDYSFFVDPVAASDVAIELFNEAPDYVKLPKFRASFYTPRNICYRQKDLSFIDYFGKGLTIIDHRQNHYTVYCVDAQLRHEIVFLTILSLVGQHCDSRRLHRVHGLGLSVNGEGILILLPSGGGKTTLLLELIKDDAVELISEDSPLIDPAGKALPFPLRIGVSHKPQDVPEEYVHLIQRMEFAPKYTIDVDFFKDKLVRRAVPVRHILCGVRCLGNESQIQPLSKYAAFSELITNSVVGVGLYQGLEFLLQRGLGELLEKTGVVFSRLNNARTIVFRAQTYCFVLGSDRAQNVKTFMDFCQRQIISRNAGSPHG
jgi:hypothetical protein